MTEKIYFSIIGIALLIIILALDYIIDELKEIKNKYH